MKSFSFYHRETGMLHPIKFSTDDERERALRANTPPDHIAIEGELDPLSQRVNLETGAVEDYQPPAPSSDHVWDAQERRWRLDPAVAERQQRRRAALAQIAALEAAQARPLRELALDPGNSESRKRLEVIEAEIAGLREQLSP